MQLQRASPVELRRAPRNGPWCISVAPGIVVPDLSVCTPGILPWIRSLRLEYGCLKMTIIPLGLPSLFLLEGPDCRRRAGEIKPTGRSGCKMAASRSRPRDCLTRCVPAFFLLLARCTNARWLRCTPIIFEPASATGDHVCLSPLYYRLVRDQPTSETRRITSRQIRKSPSSRPGAGMASTPTIWTEATVLD